MSDKTHIEWTDATWNVVTGCAKVSQGCKNCYALRDWPRLAANPKTAYFGREFTEVRCHPDRLEIPRRWTKPRRVFVNSMGDLFHEDVPDDFIGAVFTVMFVANQHTYQVLTKRPDRMRALVNRWDQIIRDTGYPTGFAGRWPNVWLGVSVEDQATADERIPLLLQTPAAVRWVSAEPLLGPIDLTAIPHLHGYGASPCSACGEPVTLDALNGNVSCKSACDGPYVDTLDWVVAGGESGPNARPMHPDWARSLRDQCAAAGVPFLFKQWGEWLPMLGQREGIPVRAKASTADGWIMGRAGKKAAGRLLDGVLHDAYPRGE